MDPVQYIAESWEDSQWCGWEGPGWYFWDEVWAHVYGPYETRYEAEKSCSQYAESLNRLPEYLCFSAYLVEPNWVGAPLIEAYAAVL